MATEGHIPSPNDPPTSNAGEAAATQPPAATLADRPHGGIGLWERIKRHKVVEWTLAYAAFAFALLHATTLLSDALEWPHVIVRSLTLILAIGLPVAPILAWYHGVRALRRINAAELILISLLLLIAGLMLWRYPRSSGGRTTVEAPAAAAVAGARSDAAASFAPPAHSIAVLPFINMSGDATQEYFSDGITEELLNALSRLDDLKVVARTSSFSFKGKDVDISTIAHKLNVGAILEGSVRRAGNTVRITAQLINTTNGFHRWSQTYDRQLSDILKVQTDVASAVAQELEVKLVGDEAVKIEVGGTHNPQAYDAYLLAKGFDRTGTLAGIRRAVPAFQKATVLDPTYAAAYAALSVSEAKAATMGFDFAGLEKARIAAERALVLAPQLPGAYLARSWVRLKTREFVQARIDVEKAVALAPNDSGTEALYAGVLATFGRLSEAIAVTRKAIALDPLNDDAWANLGLFLTTEHDYANARPALERALAISPDDTLTHTFIGVLDLQEGRIDDALEEFGKSPQERVRMMGEVVVAHARGQEQQSHRSLDELISRYSMDAPYQIAEVYSWLGDNDKAFEWFERAYQQRTNSYVASICYDPFMSNLRNDERYGSLLKQLKLN